MFVDIKGYPGYKINENGIILNEKGHVLRPGMGESCRMFVYLVTHDENGQMVRNRQTVYRLVADNFIPNPDNLPIVMHLDNDPSHCHVTNLRWGTTSDNVRQCVAEGRHYSPNKAFHRKSIYELYNDDESIVIRCRGREEIAKMLGYCTPKNVRGNKVLANGPYKGLNIRNTGEKCNPGAIFESDEVTPESQRVK